jgi:hypothetical protein
MKIKLKDCSLFPNKIVWLEYKSINRRSTAESPSTFNTAECSWRLVDDADVELIGFIPTALAPALFQRWDETDENFGILLAEYLKFSVE